MMQAWHQCSGQTCVQPEKSPSAMATACGQYNTKQISTHDNKSKLCQASMLSSSLRCFVYDNVYARCGSSRHIYAFVSVNIPLQTDFDDTSDTFRVRTHCELYSCNTYTWLRLNYTVVPVCVHVQIAVFRPMPTYTLTTTAAPTAAPTAASTNPPTSIARLASQGNKNGEHNQSSHNNDKGQVQIVFHVHNVQFSGEKMEYKMELWYHQTSQMQSFVWFKRLLCVRINLE